MNDSEHLQFFLFNSPIYSKVNSIFITSAKPITEKIATEWRDSSKYSKAFPLDKISIVIEINS